jgi:aminoglycoside phosphotransferase (APT) family kinase protein
MKEDWPRQMPAIALDAEAITRLMSPLLPRQQISSVAPVGGGLTNTNYKITFNHHEAVLLRLYQRGVAAARKELAVTRLIASRVPVLKYRYFAESNDITGHPYAILDWADAVDFQHLLPQFSRDRRNAIGAGIGAVLAAIHQFTFTMFGFFDTALAVQGPIDFDRRGLLAYLNQTLVDGPGGARLGRELTRDLMAYAERHGDRLKSWLSQACLVHGDFNAANILVEPDTGAVAAVIDWEYALSATPAIDFGNLLRPPFDEDDGFADAVARAYTRAGGFLPDDWRRLARLADVFSFADILSQPQVADVVVEDSRRVVQKLLAS